MTLGILIMVECCASAENNAIRQAAFTDKEEILFITTSSEGTEYVYSWDFGKGDPRMLLQLSAPVSIVPSEPSEWSAVCDTGALYAVETGKQDETKQYVLARNETVLGILEDSPSIFLEQPVARFPWSVLNDMIPVRRVRYSLRSMINGSSREVILDTPLLLPHKNSLHNVSENIFSIIASDFSGASPITKVLFFLKNPFSMAGQFSSPNLFRSLWSSASDIYLLTFAEVTNMLLLEKITVTLKGTEASLVSSPIAQLTVTETLGSAAIATDKVIIIAAKDSLRIHHLEDESIQQFKFPAPIQLALNRSGGLFAVWSAHSLSVFSVAEKKAKLVKQISLAP